MYVVVYRYIVVVFIVDVLVSFDIVTVLVDVVFVVEQVVDDARCVVAVVVTLFVLLSRS